MSKERAATYAHNRLELEHDKLAYRVAEGMGVRLSAEMRAAVRKENAWMDAEALQHYAREFESLKEVQEALSGS